MITLYDIESINLSFISYLFVFLKESKRKRSEQFHDCRPTKRCINVDSDLLDSSSRVECKIWEDALVSFTGCMIL